MSRTFVTVVQLLAFITVASSKQAGAATINLLSLLPYPDPEGLQPSWTEGPSLILAEQLAVDLVNNRTDILPDCRVELITGDSGCNIRTKAALSFIEGALYSVHNVSGIVGPGCSTSAVTVSPLSGQRSTALINVHVAGSLLLENRTTYPYAFGTLDSTTAFALAAQKLLVNNKWSRIGVLYDPNRVYYLTTLQYFEQLIECHEHFDCSTQFIFAVQDFSIPLDLLRDNYIHIVFLFVGPDFLRKVLCLAFHWKMLPPTYHWVIVSRVVGEITATSFTFNGMEYSCSDVDLRTMTNGSLILHYSLQPFKSSEITDSGVSYTEFLSLYEEAIHEYNSQASEQIEPSFWASAYFDATWALILALNNSREDLRERTGLELWQYKYGHASATDIVRDHLLQLDFNGVSGPIRFKRSTGYVPRIIDIYQVDDMNRMAIVAYYSSESDTIVKIDSGYEFVNNTFRQEVINISVHVAIGSIYCLLTFIELVSVFLLHILTLVFHKQKPVKASSPKLSHFAFAGCYVLVVGAVSYIIAETFSGQINPTIKCNLFYVTYFASSTGGTLIFGTVCAHVWRLYRIYVHYLRPGRLITEKVLIPLILVLFFLNLLLCSLWVGFDRLNPTLVRTQEITELQGGDSLFNIQVFLEVRCLELHSFNWLIPQLAFNLMVMGIALCLAILTRHIPHKDFKTRRIVLLVYLLSGILVVGFGSSYILQARRAAVLFQFVILSTVHNLVILFTAVFLLAPPVYSVLRELKNQKNTVIKHAITHS